MGKTFRTHYRKRNMYGSENFDVFPFCGSRFSSNDTNMLSRLCNSFAFALNQHVKLPKAVLIIINMDLMEFLEYDGCGVSTMYGTWLEWLAAEYHQMMESRIKNLPMKALHKDVAQMYWMAVPYHFEFDDGENRNRFNACLDSVMKKYDYMRMLKTKEFWDPKDNMLVVQNRITNEGNAAIWASVDAGLKFHARKHAEYVIVDDYHKLMEQRRQNRREAKNTSFQKTTKPEKERDHDEIPKFFKKYKKDHYH